MKRPPKPGETIYVTLSINKIVYAVLPAIVISVITTKIAYKARHPADGLPFSWIVRRFDEGRTWFRAGRDADAEIAALKLSGAPLQR